MTGTPTREKWSAVKLAYTAEQRFKIMDAIQRNNRDQTAALGRVSLLYPAVRQNIRDWYRERWEYLLAEYEKVLPHVDELP